MCISCNVDTFNMELKESETAGTSLQLSCLEGSRVMPIIQMTDLDVDTKLITKTVKNRGTNNG